MKCEKDLCPSSEDCACKIKIVDEECEDPNNRCKDELGGQCVLDCKDTALTGCSGKACSPTNPDCMCEYRKCKQADQCQAVGGKCMTLWECSLQGSGVCNPKLCPESKNCACHHPVPCKQDKKCKKSGGECVKDCVPGNDTLCLKNLCKGDDCSCKIPMKRCDKQDEKCKKLSGVCVTSCVAPKGFKCDSELCNPDDKECACLFKA